MPTLHNFAGADEEQKSLPARPGLPRTRPQTQKGPFLASPAAAKGAPSRRNPAAAGRAAPAGLQHREAQAGRPGTAIGTQIRLSPRLGRGPSRQPGPLSPPPATTGPPASAPHSDPLRPAPPRPRAPRPHSGAALPPALRYLPTTPPARGGPPRAAAQRPPARPPS